MFLRVLDLRVIILFLIIWIIEVYKILEFLGNVKELIKIIF